MRFLSLCSGIEAASVAWAPLGWKAAAVAEIEAFPSAVLAHHYPDVPNLGDITKFKEWPDLGTIDLICGGTPCQSFSIAGLRKGLADPRGNLSLTFLAIVDRYRPRYVIWENVPGVLSDDGGRSFASIVGGLGQLGYGWAYRVLDAQYVRVDGLGRAVPQRRRRVIVVGYLGDWRRAAAVLSEPESVLGNSPPRREAGQSAAGHAAAGFAFDGQNIASNDLEAASPTLDTGASHLNRGIHIASRTVAATLTRGAESAGKGGYAGRRQEDDDNLVAHSLRGDGFDASEDGTGRCTPLVPHAVAFQPRFARNGRGAPDVVAAPLTAEAGRTGKGDSAQCVAFDTTQMTSKANRSSPKIGDPCHPLAAGAHPPALAFNWQSGGDCRGLDPQEITGALTKEQTPAMVHGWAVRRLMPVECERLMGFPDGYTAIAYRGKPAADGPRYKALGNSWAVNVFRWVGRRIEMVEQIAADLEKERAA